MAKLRHDGEWYKNAAGVYVQGEPVGTSIMSGATTGDVLCVASDDTVEAKTLTAGTDITVTHGAGTITIASTASGGGGGTSDDPPAPGSPTAEDDEFGSSTLDAKWTEVTNGTETPTRDVHTTWPGHYYTSWLGTGGASSERLVYQPYAPSGAFSIAGKFRVAPRSDFQGVSLWASDTASFQGTGADSVVMFYRNVTNPEIRMRVYNNGTLSEVATVTLSASAPHTVFLYLHRNGSNSWDGWYSWDGWSWSRVGTSSKTVTLVNVGFSSGMYGATVPIRIGCDWFRRDWITL